MISKNIGLDTLEGHKIHISVIWVIAILSIITFITVAYYVYAGKQQALGERNYSNVKVDGKIDAVGLIESDSTISLTKGGTVTQLVNRETAVTINKYSGKINLKDDTIQPGASYSFLVNNDKVNSTDVVLLTQGVSVGVNSYNYDMWAGDVDNGSFTINMWNNDNGERDDEFSINYVIIKGSTS